MNPRPNLLKITGVQKHFGPVHVLRGVDLEVAAGEVIGFVGDNGTGKSTLMKTITGIYRADEGAVALGGQDITPSCRASAVPSASR